MLAQSAAPKTSASKAPLKCSADSALTFTRVLTVPGGYADAGLATECDASKAACPKPADLNAVAFSSKGDSKPACPVWIGATVGVFGIDDSDHFKADSIVVSLKNNGRPLKVNVAAGDNSGRTLRTQLVSGNFEALARKCTASPCTGFIQNADGSAAETLSVLSVSQYSATLQYEAADTFRPATYIINHKDGDYAFPFALLAPPVQTTATFSSPDLSQFEEVANENIVLTPSPQQPGVTMKCVTHTNDYLVARIDAPSGYTPNFVVVTNENKDKRPVVARRNTSPAVDEKAPNITYTIVDLETIRRNFGIRISQNYLVAMIEVHNPTAKKLQLNKSALWFDVDYVEAYNDKRVGFRRALGLGSDLHTNDVIIPQNARVFRYGIDHTQRHFAHNFTQILSAFDATTSSKNSHMQAFELGGAILSTIATATTGVDFGIATHLITGVVLPGIKAIALNPEEENRKRSNLVNQGLQNITPISPFGSASTLVFLPRKGILAFVDRGEQATLSTDKKDIYPRVSRPALTVEEPKSIVGSDTGRQLVPVIIKKVIDVEWDPEVISEVNAETVPKGAVKLGMTKDQVRQALGEPATVTAETDGRTCFHYPEGHYATVCFDPAGLSNSWEERSIAEQVAVAKTYEKIRTILLGDGPSVPTEKRDLVDGSYVWFDAPQLKANLQFDAKGNLMNPDYKEKYSDVVALKGKTKIDFDKAIQELGLNSDAKKMIADAIAAAGTSIAAGDKSKDISYPSPDLKGETIKVTFIKPGSATDAAKTPPTPPVKPPASTATSKSSRSGAAKPGGTGSTPTKPAAGTSPPPANNALDSFTADRFERSLRK